MTDRELLIAYMGMKMRREDWHGVADAACDLREMDAEDRGRRVRNVLDTPRLRPDVDGEFIDVDDYRGPRHGG